MKFPTCNFLLIFSVVFDRFGIIFDWVVPFCSEMKSFWINCNLKMKIILTTFWSLSTKTKKFSIQKEIILIICQIKIVFKFWKVDENQGNEFM